MESQWSDESFDSHRISTIIINREEVFKLYENHFKNIGKMDLSARLDHSEQMASESQNVSQGQGIAGGGSPFRDVSRNTIRSGSSGVAPLQTGVSFQLGYGTFTPNIRNDGEISDVYLGSPPGSSLGNQEYQTLEYGYGTQWVNEYMTRPTGRGAVPRRSQYGRRLQLGQSSLDTLVEMPAEGAAQDTQVPERELEFLMGKIPSSTPASNRHMRQVPDSAGRGRGAGVHLDLTAHVGSRWRGGRARRLPFLSDQERLLPDSSLNVDLEFPVTQNFDSRTSVVEPSLQEVEQEISELFIQAQNIQLNQTQQLAAIAAFDPKTRGTPHLDTSHTNMPHSHPQNHTQHSHSHSRSNTPSQQQQQQQHHSGRQQHTGGEGQMGGSGGGGGDGDDSDGSGDDGDGHGGGHRGGGHRPNNHRQRGQNDTQDILHMMSIMMQDSERRTVRMMEMVHDQNIAIQQQMAQAPRVINDVLNNFNRTYQQWSHIKLVGIDPFDPDRESGKGRNGERTESDVRIFLQKILPTLLQENYAEVTRIRTLIFYTRGSARDYLSGYPQDGSIPLTTFINDLDYYFQRRESPHTLMAHLQKATRKPGQNLIQYNLSLKRITDRLIRMDDNMRSCCVMVVWSKVLDECPSELRALIQQHFRKDQLNDILAYIGNWTGNHPDKSPFAPAKLQKERNDCYKSKNSNVYNNNFNSRKSTPNKPKYSTNFVSRKALPTTEMLSEDEDSSLDDAEVNALSCFNCKEPGHLARDCHKGSQNQTVPKERKFNSNFSKSNKNSDKVRYKSSDEKKTKDVTHSKGNIKTKCRVCFKTNHPTNKCFVLKRVQIYLKENHANNKINFLAHTLEDPYDENVQDLRQEICHDVDWPACDILEEEIESVVTAVLQLPETYIFKEDEDEDDSY